MLVTGPEQILAERAVESTLEALAAVDNTVLGLVLNRVDSKSGEGTGYYGYYSDEQTLKTRGDRRKQAKRSGSRKAAV